MARKVFISVLGFTNYGQCTYVKGDYKSSCVRFIQEATLDYFCQQKEWSANDAAYILLTSGAEKANWYDDGHKDKNTGEVIKCEGLCSRLQKMELPFTINTIKNLPDGNTEEEIWDIFERVFNELQDGDELYFDLTHGFRYLPMLVMVLINYSKFLKNTSVKSITYGNYESRHRVTNEAPIIDLLPLSVLQDWTYAAGQFLDSGNVQRLAKLSREKINPILKESKGEDVEASILKKVVAALEATVDDMQACRGINLVTATNLKTLKSEIAQLQKTFITPLNPIFDKIKYRFKDFADDESIKNGFIAAKWCLENNLYQQAITILQENIVTMICIEQNIDYKNKELREIVNKAFNILEKNRSEEEWKFSSTATEEGIESQKQLIKKVLKSDKVKSLCSSFAVCTNIRNDFNHAGMGENPSKAGKLKMGIKERIEKVMNLLYD